MNESSSVEFYMNQNDEADYQYKILNSSQNDKDILQNSSILQYSNPKSD